MILNIIDASCKRDNIYILKNINWTVQPGEHWAIIGLNGSGKTSLLKLINGYIFPSEGEVTVLGKRFGEYDYRELRKSIGWVSSSLQEALYPGETVAEIVISGKYASIGLYEKPEDTEFDKAHNLLEQFGCAGLGKRMYYTLSQGEKQKVILARALMSSPKLLILDEPCTGLDIFARENFLSLIEEIGAGKDSPCMLYVSHHIEEILLVFSHSLLLKKGSVHSQGIKDDILTELNLNDFFNRRVSAVWKDGRMWVHPKA